MILKAKVYCGLCKTFFDRNNVDDVDRYCYKYHPYFQSNGPYTGAN